MTPFKMALQPNTYMHFRGRHFDPISLILRIHFISRMQHFQKVKPFYLTSYVILIKMPQLRVSTVRARPKCQLCEEKSECNEHFIRFCPLLSESEHRTQLIHMNGTHSIRIIHFMVVSNRKSSCPTFFLVLPFRRNISNANTLFIHTNQKNITNNPLKHLFYH